MFLYPNSDLIELNERNFSHKCVGTALVYFHRTVNQITNLI